MGRNRNDVDIEQGAGREEDAHTDLLHVIPWRDKVLLREDCVEK
jgi:hypothetical protein